MLLSKDRIGIIKLCFMITIFAITIVSCSHSREISIESKSNIESYEFGQDRTELTEFEKEVLASAHSSEKKNSLEEKLIKILSGDATFASKQFASRQLRIIGSENSVPILTELLKNEKTSDLATYALENINGIKVDKALLETIPLVNKKTKLGIINTLAVRSNQSSVSGLSKLLEDSEIDIAVASARALGKIANKACSTTLNSYINSSNKQLKAVVLDSYLACADKMVIENNSKYAYDIYSKIYAGNNPSNIRKAALVGLINSADNKLRESTERISNEPDAMKQVAISKLRELLEDKDAVKIAKLIPSLSSTNQIQLISVIEEISDNNCKPYILQTLDSEIAEVRISSIRALANVGDETDVMKLAEIASSNIESESEQARTSLRLLKGDKVDETILSNIQKVEESTKRELISAIASRNIRSGTNTVLQYSDSEDRLTKNVVYKTLGEIATDENLNQLLDILDKEEGKTEKRKIERTISSVVKKSQNKTNATTLLITFFESTKNSMNKESILRILGNSNNKSAYKILSNELVNSNEDVKIAAIQGLSIWSTPEPLNTLLNVAETTSSDNIRSAALKGFTNFISLDEKLADDQKVELYIKSLSLAKTGNERNIALDGIGHVDNFSSLEVFKSYINQPDVKETVDDGINRVSWHIFKNDPERVRNNILYFMKQVKDEKFQTKSQQLLDVIDRFIKKRDNN